MMRRIRVKRIGVVLPIVMALAGCGSDPAPVPAGDGTASGEVLEGSISDAMLPLDTVQSQSPPMEKAPSEPGDSASDPAGEDDDSAEAPEPSPEADEPAPEE
jgi:hypothetical protein